MVVCFCWVWAGFFFLVSYKKLAEVDVFSSILILTVELLI